MRLHQGYLVLFSVFYSWDVAFAKDDPKQVIKTAEEIRSPVHASSVVDLTSITESGTIIYGLEILSSRDRKALVDFKKPKEEFGRKLLVIGRQYWASFPESKRIIELSRREMIGNSAFAIADIFQIDADEDYNVLDMKDGLEDKTPTLILSLKAKHKEAPYEAIRYVVTKQGYFPVKADFLSATGKLIKTMTVQQSATLAGMRRPSVLLMQDQVMKARTSTWKVIKMAKTTIPAGVFTKDSLRSR